MSAEASKIKQYQEKHLGKLHPGRWRGLLILIVLAGVVVSSAGCLFFGGSIFGGKDPEGPELYQLSAGQAEIVQEIGYPEAFILLFYAEEAPFGSLRTVRQETWEYYSQGASYTFLNGELEGKVDLDVDGIGSLAPQPYTPEQFSAHMDRDGVLEAAGVDEFIEVPVEKEFLELADLYYAESLAFGLVDGELRYLEALALVEE